MCEAGYGFPRRPLLVVATPINWGESETISHMLGKSKSSGPQGFTVSLALANMHPRGIAKGRGTSSCPTLPGPFSTHRQEQGYAQFPRISILGISVNRVNSN